MLGGIFPNNLNKEWNVCITFQALDLYDFTKYENAIVLEIIFYESWSPLNMRNV